MNTVTWFFHIPFQGKISKEVHTTRNCTTGCTFGRSCWEKSLSNKISKININKWSRILCWFILLCHVGWILRVRRDHIPNSCNTRQRGREGQICGLVGGTVTWKLPEKKVILFLHYSYSNTQGNLCKIENKRNWQGTRKQSLICENVFFFFF